MQEEQLVNSCTTWLSTYVGKQELTGESGPAS